MTSYNHEAVDGVELLSAAGRALYGERWQSPLARDLGTTYRTIRNWMDERHPTPADLVQRLRSLLIERGVEIEAVIGRIDTHTK